MDTLPNSNYLKQMCMFTYPFVASLHEIILYVWEHSFENRCFCMWQVSYWNDENVQISYLDLNSSIDVQNREVDFTALIFKNIRNQEGNNVHLF